MIVIGKLRTEAILADIRREAVRLHRDAPEPVVINIDAVLCIGRSREFEWGARKLRAPPLTYARGIRLLVAANALRDLREHNAPPKPQKAALRLAASLVRDTVTSTRWWYGLRWSRAFTDADSETLEGLLRWLLDIPDASTPPEPSKRQVTIDLVDVLAGFARDFPAWMGKDGLPLSWAHYLYGLRHLGRASAREDLRRAVANRAGQSDEKGWKEFYGEMRQAAGW